MMRITPPALNPTRAKSFPVHFTAYGEVTFGLVWFEVGAPGRAVRLYLGKGDLVRLRYILDRLDEHLEHLPQRGGRKKVVAPRAKCPRRGT